MLTERAIRDLKPRPGAEYMVCDSGGLYIRVGRSGRKTWVYRKQQRGGPSRLIILGVFPAMGLYEARRARDEVKGKAAEKSAGVTTFKELAERYLDAGPRRSFTEKTVSRMEYRLTNYVYPKLASVSTVDINSPMVYALVHEIELTGKIELAHRVSMLIGQVLRFGIPQGVVPQGDVTRDLRDALAAVKSTPRAHLETPAEVAVLMRKIMDMPAGMTRAGLLLQAYTLVRPGELRFARWDEIDLESATWRIPAEKMKMRRPHIVPLSRQVLEILTMLKDSISAGSPLVLHGVRSLTRPISDMRLLNALRDLGYEKHQMSVHGFRAIASTLLNENGWPPDAIEAQLAHDTGGTVRAVYNYAQYMNIRRAMVQWYADYLDALAKGEKAPEKPSLSNS